MLSIEILHILHVFMDLLMPLNQPFFMVTCAHDMNTVSTATVLPHTPTDINGILSVVFVGAGNFNPKSLGKMFRIRKMKVWNFLLWLKDSV